MDKKVCTKCKLLLELSNFGNRKNKKGVLIPNGVSRCKACGRKYDKAMRKTDKGKRLITLSLRRRNEQRKKWILNELKTNRCKYCNESNIACLEFHHKYGEKKFNLSSRMIKNKQAVLEEAKKCEVVCANCHRKIHWRD